MRRSEKTMEEHLEKAKILTEALPYIQKFHGKTMVIKYGGSAMKEARLRTLFAKDVVLMKYVGINPVIVHGGGPQIGQILSRLGMSSRFVRGMRVTDAATMEVVEMVLSGKINKDLVQLIIEQGGKAVGLSGKDGGLVRARKVQQDPSAGEEDLGFVGEVVEVNSEIIQALEQDRYIPVVAPIGFGDEGETYNINADLVAGSLAAALKAHKLILLTDVPGVLDASGKLISAIRLSELSGLVSEGAVTGGMIPKVRCCAEAVSQGVTKAHVIDGRIEHSVLLEVFTDQGVGTQIYAG
jgi:acetylglutamate kinase